MSIEVLDGSVAASQWAEAWGDRLVESALSHGAVDFSWKPHRWGLVLEIGFADDTAWSTFRNSAALQAALDTVPEPAAVIIFRGRASNAGTSEPRKPKPMFGSGAASLSLPVLEPLVKLDLHPIVFGDLPRLTTTSR